MARVASRDASQPPGTIRRSVNTKTRPPRTTGTVISSTTLRRRASRSTSSAGVSSARVSSGGVSLIRFSSAASRSSRGPGDRFVSRDCDALERRRPHASLGQLGQERHRLDQRTEAMDSGPIDRRRQASRQPCRRHRENGAGRHRGALHDPVHQAIDDAVTAAPDVDPRRAPLPFVAELAAEATALRRLTELDARRAEPTGTRRSAARSPRSPAGSRGRRSAPETTRGCRRADGLRASVLHAICARASGARDARCRRSRVRPNPCARTRISSTFSKLADAWRTSTSARPGDNPHATATVTSAARAFGSSARN